MLERPHVKANAYTAFVDPSGGSSDAMTLAIAHTEGKTQILDAIRGAQAAILAGGSRRGVCQVGEVLSVFKVIGDRYGGEWVVEQFMKRGVFVPASQERAT